ncbi:unnamed protein product, partial [Brassica rapa subsp. narinosa]
MKKKPKNSSAKKSSPKRASPAMISPADSSFSKALSEESAGMDRSPPSQVVASDAQVVQVVDEVAQQSNEAPDLTVPGSDSNPSKTVIVAKPTDPSLLTLVDVDPVPQAVAGALEQTLPSTDPLPDAKETSSPPASQAETLALTSADANEGLSSQIDDLAPVTSVLETVTEPDAVTKSVPANQVLENKSPENLEPEKTPNQWDTPLKVRNEPIKPSPKDDWCTHAKGYGKPLNKKGEAFVLPSGEACVKIPNSVIEKNRKSWEPFVLGQFYSEPPSQGTLHNIVNGIWSKQYRDIAVSKMEGFSFLFRIPNAATRNRVIKQCLWQIEGQTMFVDKWEPGTVPVKPELTSAPIWLELRKVPFQFFNEDGLERIAGLVGHPKFLHPSTANKTNLEVAKVFTIIDPRKPLPEAVN